MSYIRLSIKKKDKDGFAWFKSMLEFSEDEFARISKALESIQADVPSLVFEVEKVEEIKL